MNNRERIKAVLKFEEFDRLPIIEWAPWWKDTIKRWHNEGLPASVQTGDELEEHFELDGILRAFIGGLGPDTPSPEFHGAKIIENQSDYEKILPTLYEQIDLSGFEQLAKKQEKEDKITLLYTDGFFWFPRILFGIENHLYGFYDNKELMHRINKDLSDYIIKAFTQLFEVCCPEIIYFQEDLSYNHGPMLSKEQYDEFLKPYYLKVLPALKKSEATIFVDTDGQVKQPVSWFEETGIEGVWPLERQAGVDIAQLRQDHPGMRFLGGFDKTIMHKGEKALRSEFERLNEVASKGGYVISCDHQTPPEVSYDDYLLYIKLFREYALKH